jgi:predicted ATPase
MILRMEKQTPLWYVLTGGPCAGKTTTINELALRGYPVLAEPARLIIDEKLAAGHTIEEIVGDPDWLPSVVRRAHAQESEVPPGELFFFDRATPDSLAYYRLSNRPVEEFFREAMQKIRYRKVFLLDLVDFENDDARTETLEQAMLIHTAIREAYEEQGYEIMDVPVMPVRERADFILQNL